MFEHSVKVPRHYKIAANIFKKVSSEGGSVKSLLYDDKLRHFRTNVLYALITETIKHAVDLEKIFDSCSILQKEPRLDPWLAKVLTAELLFGKKSLPGKSKPEQTILSYKDQFEKYTADNEESLKTEVVRRPRYVRINTSLLTTSDAIGAFQDDGYRFVRCTSSSYNDYLKQIENLSEYDFTQDFHIKTIFVFSPGTKLHEHYLYLENKIILQDKATALAVHVLAPPAGSIVLDLCAAPGMKTTQVAAYMRNEGKVYAIERNENRYKTLCEFVEKTESKCVETVHKDALDIKRGEYSDVEYILLDPSCSGSGMEFCVHNYIEDTRLAKLTSLQEKFLKHAMNAFPNAKRIVYSTCSLYPEENERVITNVVKTSRTKWRVQEVKDILKDQWNNFGSGMYGSMGAKCLYARPDTDFTTGFFLAVLDRDEKELKKQYNEKIIESVKLHNGEKKDMEQSEIPKKKKKNNDEHCNSAINDKAVDSEHDKNDNSDDKNNKKHKKKKKRVISDSLNEDNIEKEIPKIKKKKHKRERDELVVENQISNNSTKDEEIIEPLKKKKKKSNKEVVLDAENLNLEVVEEILPKKKKKKKHNKSEIDA